MVGVSNPGPLDIILFVDESDHYANAVLKSKLLPYIKPEP